MSIAKPDRRRFLRWLSSVAVSTSMPASVLATPHLAPAKPDPLDFIQLDGLGPEQAGELIETRYCPLHKSRTIPREAISPEQYQATKQQLIREFNNQGQTWKPEYTVAWNSQHYAVPDHSSHCRHLLEYCQQVQRHLYQHIPGLFPLDLSWQLLDADCAEPAGNAFRAFVGRYTYMVMRVVALDKLGNIVPPYLIHASPLERSLNFIRSERKKYTPIASTIYIIPGLTALSAPFSEILHISTNAPTLHLARHLSTSHNLDAQATETAREFGELVTEALSIQCAYHYLHQIKRKDKLPQLSTLNQHLSAYLPHFAQMQAHIRQLGLINAYHSFRDSPVGFWKAFVNN